MNSSGIVKTFTLLHFLTHCRMTPKVHHTCYGVAHYPKLLTANLGRATRCANNRLLGDHDRVPSFSRTGATLWQSSPKMTYDFPRFTRWKKIVSSPFSSALGIPLWAIKRNDESPGCCSTTSPTIRHGWTWSVRVPVHS